MSEDKNEKFEPNQRDTGTPGVEDPRRRDDIFIHLHQSTNRSSSASLVPSDGETLRGYVGRIRAELALISQLHINIQGGYYSHTNPAGCYNCKAIIIGSAISKLLAEVAEQLDRIEACGIPINMAKSV